MSKDPDQLSADNAQAAVIKHMVILAQQLLELDAVGQVFASQLGMELEDFVKDYATKGASL